MGSQVLLNKTRRLTPHLQLGRCIRCDPQKTPMWARRHVGTCGRTIEISSRGRCIFAFEAGLGRCEILELSMLLPRRDLGDNWLRQEQIGGGTGYNIEAMQAFLDVPTFFSAVYLVDLSPSLCAVAIKRFKRLGWDVKVLCQDARTFQLEDHLGDSSSKKYTAKPVIGYPSNNVEQRAKADVITMSYSLSMIPDYYSLVDSLTGLLAPHGIIGVVDFYVQSIVETAGRNYIGGSFNRHVNWLSRVVWRSWFDCDRVGLEAARRVSFWNLCVRTAPFLTLLTVRTT